MKKTIMPPIINKRNNAHKGITIFSNHFYFLTSYIFLLQYVKRPQCPS
jgi:hypothetical protein